MSDVYGSGLWGDAPPTATERELEGRRFDRPASGAARTRAVAGSASEWLSFNLAGEALARGAQSTDPLDIMFMLAGQPVAHPLLQPNELNERYGIDGVLSFDEPTTESWAAHRYERARRDLFRQDVISRAEDGGPVTDFLVSLGVGIADPINFVLPFGRLNALRAAAPSLAALETSEQIAPRMVARALFGAAEGAVYSAAMEPAYYGLANLTERDYGLQDSLINVLAGAGFSGVFGGLGGAFDGPRADPRGRAEAEAERAQLPPEIARADAATREAAFAEAVGAIAEGRESQAGRIFDLAADEFQTADGAVYVRERGEQTTRFDDGARGRDGERAFETIYVTPETADALRAMNSGEARFGVSDRGVSLYAEAEGGAWRAADKAGDLPFERTPREGLVPVELFGAAFEIEGYRSARIGSEIVAVSRRGEPGAVRLSDPDERGAVALTGEPDAPADAMPDAATRAAEAEAERVRMAEGRDRAAEEIALQLESYGEDAAPIARVLANGLGNIGAHYGETAADVAAAIGLRIEDAGGAPMGDGARFEQGGSFVGTPEYEAAKRQRDAIQAEVDATGATLRELSGGGGMNLTPDSVRATPEWQAARRAYDDAFGRLRQFNATFTKRFAREMRDERRVRGYARSTPQEAVSPQSPDGSAIRSLPRRIVDTPKGEVIVNPTQADMMRLTRPQLGKEKFRTEDLRWIRDAEGNVYVGRAFDMNHDEIAAAVGGVKDYLPHATPGDGHGDKVRTGQVSRDQIMSGQRFQQSPPLPRTMRERRQLRRAIRRADKDVAIAERQATAFLAAAECIMREGFTNAGGRGSAELLAGLALGQAAAIPVGVLAANYAADNENPPLFSEEWIRRARARGAQLEFPYAGGIGGEERYFEGQRVYRTDEDPDWIAPGENYWVPPEPDDTPGELGGTTTAEGGRVSMAVPGEAPAAPADPGAEAQALITAFAPFVERSVAERQALADEAAADALLPLVAQARAEQRAAERRAQQ